MNWRGLKRFWSKDNEINPADERTRQRIKQLG